jgi:hypothetical protein
LNSGIDAPATGQNDGPNTALVFAPVCCRSPYTSCDPSGYPVSPVVTANRAPLAATCDITFAWSGLAPVAST